MTSSKSIPILNNRLVIGRMFPESKAMGALEAWTSRACPNDKEEELAISFNSRNLWHYQTITL